MKQTKLIKTLSLGLISVALAACMSCTEKSSKTELKKYKLTHDTEFNSVYIGDGIDKFNEDGFAYGDSLNLYFSNGISVEDVPYYTGYYNKTGNPLLCAYPGYISPLFTVSNLGNSWETYNLSDDDYVEVSLNTKGKYKNIEESMSLKYSDNIDDYDSDVTFANIRALKGGNMKENVFYRSASPIDNRHKRAAVTDKLISEIGIDFALNLADTDEKVTGFTQKDDFNSPYYLSLFNNDKVAAIALKSDFSADIYKQNLAKGLKKLCTSQGPYLMHCTEGKDRTGFAAILLEALCGADFDEIKADYMETYNNYYGISEESNPEKYETVSEFKFNELIFYLADAESEADVKNTNLVACAEKYLQDGGMTSDEISTLKLLISND